MRSPFTGGLSIIVREVSQFYDQSTQQTYDILSSHYKCVDSELTFTTSKQDEEWVANVLQARRVYKLNQIGI